LKQKVITKLKEQLDYINEIEILKTFWKSNYINIEKIIAHYFSYTNFQGYKDSKEHYDNLVENIITYNTEQVKDKLKILIKDLEKSESIENYIKLLNKQLSLNQHFSYEFNNLKDLNAFNKDININNLLKDIPTFNINNSIVDSFESIYPCILNLKTLSQFLSNMELLEILKNEDENLILIGANGSGKSTFSRQIKQNLSSNFNSFVAVIPAQKIFNVFNNSSIPLKKNAQQEYTKVHTQDKLFKSSNDMIYDSEFEKMRNYLIAEHQEKANRTHQNWNNSDFKKKTLF